LAKRSLADGRLGVLIFPQEKDVEKARAIIQRVPILESALRKPNEADVNK
jgi:hypothetical protein